MDKYGLIGYPLGHSFSISYFNEKFKNEGIDAVYENYEIPTIEQLPEVLDTNPELRGLNVTIPYKEKVISYLDSLSPEASEIGAVNVIKIEHKGKKTVLKGYNSDVIGFTRSIEPLLEPYHKKALILGTGRYTDITPEMMKEYNVIVNCTPCGMFPHADECPDLPYNAMDNHTLLYDLIYNPDETLFLTKGKKKGAIIKNGLEMLLLQAFASWEFWNK